MRQAELRLLALLPLLWAAVASGAPFSDSLASARDAALPQLSALPPLERLRRLETLAAEGPAARNLAAAIARPELLESGRAELERRLGAAQFRELAAAAAELQVEARADERVMAGLEALARRLSPQGSPETLELGEWFDGALRPARVERALSWPVDEPQRPERSVHTITAREGRLLINGKAAELLRKRGDSSAARLTFAHPDDKDLLVELFHSPGSLDAFDRKEERLRALEPLSRAGAAAKVLEHGEIAVPGKGRVHFYAQERIDGAKLADLPFDARALEQVRGLFQRMADAGLALVVPGADQSWLLSHIMLGKTKSGGERAYLLGGELERGEPSGLAGHYAMLLSLLQAERPKPRAAADAQDAPSAALSSDKLQALAASSPVHALAVEARLESMLAPLLRRHGLSAQTSELGSERAVVAAATALLLDPEAARVSVHPDLKRRIEARGLAALRGTLALVPPSPARDATILKAPGAAWARTESADALSVLLLLQDAGAYAKAPPEAWRRLLREDARRLVAQRVKLGDAAGARDAARLWVLARRRKSAPAGLDADVSAVAQALPAPARTELLVALWPTIDKAPEPERLALVELLPPELRVERGELPTGKDVAPALRAIFESGLKPQGQMNALQNFLDSADRLNAKSLVYLLENMPRGVNWGWKKDKDESKALGMHERMKEVGVAHDWQLSEFMHMDVELAARAIRKTQAPRADAERLAEVPKLFKAILKKSRERKGKVSAYQVHLESYLFAEYRLLTERLK